MHKKFCLLHIMVISQQFEKKEERKIEWVRSLKTRIKDKRFWSRKKKKEQKMEFFPP